MINFFKMKKTILLLVVLFVTLSCKNDKKEVKKLNEVEQEKEKVEMIINVEIPKHTSWGKVRISIEEAPLMYGENKAYTLSRTTTSESSFVHTQKITAEWDTDYRASVIVKKKERTNFFAMRISAAYPDRVDAIFDLGKGEVKGVKSGRDFKNESATIQSLGDGWYKCMIKVMVSDDNIKIGFGPTSEENKIAGWEGKTNDLEDIYIIPSSLVLEKISYN